MDLGFITLLVIAVILVIIVFFLVRTFVRFILIGIIIYFLFHVGFIWGVGDLNEKLHLDKIFNSEADKKIQDTYGAFVDKREDFGMVDTKEVKSVIDTTIQKAITEAGNQIKAVNKDALLEELKTKLAKYNDQVVKEALNQSKSELKKVMTLEQIDTLSKK